MSQIDLTDKHESCPNCGMVREAEEIHNKEHVTIKGKDIEFDSVSYKCKTCGKTFETLEQLDNNLASAKKEYEKQELKVYGNNIV